MLANITKISSNLQQASFTGRYGKTCKAPENACIIFITLDCRTDYSTNYEYGHNYSKRKEFFPSYIQL